MVSIDITKIAILKGPIISIITYSASRARSILLFQTLKRFSKIFTESIRINRSNKIFIRPNCIRPARAATRSPRDRLDYICDYSSSFFPATLHVPGVVPLVRDQHRIRYILYPGQKYKISPL